MTDQTQSEGIPSEFVVVEGVMWPKLFERSRPMAEHVKCIRALEMKDDDVILCAYCKSGTHWLWEVGKMILAGKAEYEKRTKEHVMMEANDFDDLQKMTSPRLFNTHFPLSMLPAQAKDGSKKVKFIHVYRNPKDVFVSYYYHNKQMPGREDKTMATFLDNFLSGKCVGGSYFDYLKAMDDFIRQNPHLPIFNMSFEEMKEDPVSTVRRLSRFLQVEASDQLCQDIADACTFHKLKAADKDKHRPVAGLAGKKPIQMYRKGDVGDWKNNLTVAQSERIDAAMTQLKDCTNFRFRFTLK